MLLFFITLTICSIFAGAAENNNNNNNNNNDRQESSSSYGSYSSFESIVIDEKKTVARTPLSRTRSKSCIKLEYELKRRHDKHRSAPIPSEKSEKHEEPRVIAPKKTLLQRIVRSLSFEKESKKEAPVTPLQTSVSVDSQQPWGKYDKSSIADRRPRVQSDERKPRSTSNVSQLKTRVGKLSKEQKSSSFSSYEEVDKHKVQPQEISQKITPKQIADWCDAMREAYRELPKFPHNIYTINYLASEITSANSAEQIEKALTTPNNNTDYKDLAQYIRAYNQLSNLPQKIQPTPQFFGFSHPEKELDFLFGMHIMKHLHDPLLKKYGTEYAQLHLMQLKSKKQLKKIALSDFFTEQIAESAPTNILQSNKEYARSKKIENIATLVANAEKMRKKKS